MGLSRWRRFWSVDVPGGAIGLGLNALLWRRLYSIAESKYALA